MPRNVRSAHLNIYIYICSSQDKSARAAQKKANLL